MEKSTKKPSNKPNKDKYTWHSGDTTMTVNGVQGKYKDGKFVPTKSTKK